MLTYLVDGLNVLTGPVEFPEVPGIGRQLPSNAIELEDLLPPANSGFAWALVDAQPVQLADHRGTVYQTANGEAVTYAELGELPEAYTTAPKPGPFYQWAEGAWVEDVAAVVEAARKEALQKRDAYLEVATLRIAPLQDAVDLGDATAEEEAQLLAWKRYRVALNRVQQQEGFPQDVAWPVKPD